MLTHHACSGRGSSNHNWEIWEKQYPALKSTQWKILCNTEYSYLVFQVVSYFRITESSDRFLFPDAIFKLFFFFK